ncbi:hypothetical protein [Bailinhaonella thermotolerans]|uniref:Uncharacterized protein n=1 Tax=Bailinhaonella thermotolerans TaxID=1070861 RepID=A0A3A4ABG8_9ACTN|nr:hypothetical protein [Bailinhaonella thermotolerans]RJL26606.1 hypothetical protein D5H75_26900 [Bailinhaonella thermotolerans]
MPVEPAALPVISEVAVGPAKVAGDARVSFRARVRSSAPHGDVQVFARVGDRTRVRLARVLGDARDGVYTQEHLLRRTAGRRQRVVIEAVDAAGGRRTPAKTITVGRPAPGAPALSRVRVSPESLRGPDDFRLRAEAAAPAGVTGVTATLLRSGTAPRRITLERVGGDARRGSYEARVDAREVGRTTSYTVVFEASGANGTVTAAGRPLTIVPELPAPEIVEVRAPRHVTLTPEGARVRIEARVRGHAAVDLVLLTGNGAMTALTPDGGGCYHADIRLRPAGPHGPQRYVVEAFDRQGHISRPAKAAFTVRRQVFVTGYDAGPEPVRRGRTITASGRLHALNATGAGLDVLGGRRVELQFRRFGSSVYTTYAVLRTDAQGRFRARFRARTDGYWRARHPGSDRFAPVHGWGDHVDVRGPSPRRR